MEGQPFSVWFYTAACTGLQPCVSLECFGVQKAEDYTILFGMFNGVGVFAFVFSEGQVMQKEIL